MNSIDETLKDRGSRYGEFPMHAEITQGIKEAMGVSRNWLSIDDDMKECLEMVAHKIGRILNGDPQYIDSWTDIIGYTRLVEKRLIDEQATAKIFAFPNDRKESGAMDAPDAEPAEEECDCGACQFRRMIEGAFAKRA